MIGKFNFYDFIANLVPGLTFLWALEQIGKLVSWNSPVPLSGQLAEASVLVILSYVTGLMLQALSERVTEKKLLFKSWGGFPSARWLLPKDPKFSPEYKQRIFTLIEERFKISTSVTVPEGCTPAQELNLRLKKNQELFYLCYNYVDNLSPRPQIFNAQYGLFRGLVTTFGLLCLLSIVFGLWNWACQPVKHASFAWVAVTFAVLAWLSYARCTKRGDDFARSIYDLFVGGTAGKASGT